MGTNQPPPCHSLPRPRRALPPWAVSRLKLGPASSYSIVMKMEPMKTRMARQMIQVLLPSRVMPGASTILKSATMPLVRLLAASTMAMATAAI